MTEPLPRLLPDDREAITHKFDIAGYEGYITVGLFEDRTPGEIYLVMAKEGSTISGFADAFARAVSLCLQYGVPLAVLIDNFQGVRFQPSGQTRHKEIGFAKSIVDYVFRWLGHHFLPQSPESAKAVTPTSAEDGPSCSTCGQIMHQSGTCWKCGNCGSTKGCI